MSAPLAIENQKIAADPKLSVWVSANAGAGKTHVLVNRILRLMLSGAKPHKILSLTFTKAAAAEMANRLHRELGSWAVISDEELQTKLTDLTMERVDGATMRRARRLFAAVLDTPGGMKIQTIHSFCQAVLARFPIESGISPRFHVLDDRESASLLSEAKDIVLQRATDGTHEILSAALSRIVAETDDLSFDKLLNALLSGRARLKRLFEKDIYFEGMAHRIRLAFGLNPSEDEAALLGQFCASCPDADLKKVAIALAEGSKTNQKFSALLDLWLENSQGRTDIIEAYLEIFIKADSEARNLDKFFAKALREKHPSVMAILAEEQARAIVFRDRRRAVLTADRTIALLALGRAILDEFELAKTRQGVLDFEDIILKTRALLNHHGARWVLYKLDGGIDHILVDEAQDSSPDQWSIVEALADEFFAGEGAKSNDRTLFAVGDEKQSIYSFQGAVPEYFERMRDIFAAKARQAESYWRGIDLDLSFRSTPAVLQAVDLVFSHGEAKAGVAASHHRIRHVPHRKGQPGLVEVWPTIADEKGPDREPWTAPLDRVSRQSGMVRLAQTIARRIQRWLEQGERLESQNRPIRPGDIMILVRRRNRFTQEMIKALKAQGLPVAGSDRMMLLEQLAVMDLVALGRFLLLPEDDLTLATVLKGPLYNLTDEDLLLFAPSRTGSLWQALCTSGRYSSAAQELMDLLAVVDFRTPYDFYAELLGARAGRRRISERLGEEAADPLDEFLRLALDYERIHPPSLEGFLHWLESAPTVIKRDMESQTDAIRVMTVHGAKGLEANIVILPETCQMPGAKGRNPPPILWHQDTDISLPLWSPRKPEDPPLCRMAREIHQQKEEAEYRRLLYVAMTRARDRLYITGYEGSEPRTAGCWYDLNFAALKGQAASIEDPELGTILRLADDVQESQITEVRIDQDTKISLPPSWLWASAPSEPSPSLPLAPSRPEMEEAGVLSPLGEGNHRRFQRGRIIHRLLQSLPDLPEPQREDATWRFLRSAEFSLSPEAQTEIFTETFRLINDPRMGSIFGPGSRAEVSLAGLLGKHSLAGQIDRLLVTSDRVIVVDYKSNRPPPQNPSQVPILYLRQMALYVALLTEIYPNKSVEPILIWTDGPILMPLSQKLLSSYMP